MRSARLVARGGRVRLRAPERGDFRDWQYFRLLDEHLLRPVEPTLDTDWASAHDRRAFRRLLRGWRVAEREGLAVTAVIEVDGHFAGMLTLGSITPFPIAHAWIGYWVGSAFTGGGVATAAVALACDYATKLGIHRIEATVLETNGSSESVLERCGFVFEGVAREAFHMDGEWRDHRAYARVSAASAVESIVAAGYARYEEAEKFPPERRA
nr:GNAT family protein [Corynebacterium lactis]